MRGGYNRNYLMKVRLIQDINRQWEGGWGRTYAWVWRNKVYPTYPCHYNTYIKMMGINVNVELRKIKEREMAAIAISNQLPLF